MWDSTLKRDHGSAKKKKKILQNLEIIFWWTICLR